jgi:diacylglycerol kinase (ATP)
MGKNIHLLYNPGAGHGQHDEKKLITLIEAAGHQCSYKSVKEKGWQEIPADTDWVAVAGGDGTVRKIIQRITERNNGEPAWPIGIIPLGTANNIANSVGSIGTPGQLVESWGRNSTRFNTATVKQGKKETFLCEAMGFGLFPEHLLEMKRNDPDDQSPDEKMKAECEILLESLEDFKPRRYQIEADGYKQTGDFLLVQVMNIRMIGPKLLLAPNANAGDGLLDMIAFTEDDRSRLQHYLQKRIAGEHPQLQVESVRVKKVVIHSADKRYHVEDELLQNDQDIPVEIIINEEPLRLFIL